ncbi:hypothetical protein [Nocardia sp. NPDC052566]|uniref:hypothetical protein n=1 Tax=Nocardia sp. NPDC052566 TaxID=3364330 RepID=UPI0037C7BCF4
MTTNENSSVTGPRRPEPDAAAPVWLFRVVWAIGALAIAASVSLVVVAFKAQHTWGGEFVATGQSADAPLLLGLIAFLFGAAVLICALLVRSALGRLASFRQQ